VGIPSAAEQAAEKVGFWVESRKKRVPGAKEGAEKV
jgi:hypothetical protein